MNEIHCSIRTKIGDRESIREGHTEQDSIDFKLYLEQTGVRVY